MQSGGFSEDSLDSYQSLLSSLLDEEEVYDFARCVRPDGSFYGTRGRCMPPNKPAAVTETRGGIGQQPPANTTPAISGGVSRESANILSSLIRRRDRQTELLRRASFPGRRLGGGSR